MPILFPSSLICKFWHKNPPPYANLTGSLLVIPAKDCHPCESRGRNPDILSAARAACCSDTVLLVCLRHTYCTFPHPASGCTSQPDSLDPQVKYLAHTPAVWVNNSVFFHLLSFLPLPYDLCSCALLLFCTSARRVELKRSEARNPQINGRIAAYPTVFIFYFLPRYAVPIFLQKLYRTP